MLRSPFKNDSLQKPSFLLRSVLMITLILAFASNVYAQSYSTDGWCFDVLPDGTATLMYPVQVKWDNGQPKKFVNYERRIESSLTYPSTVTIQTLNPDKLGFTSGATYTVTSISNSLSAVQKNALVNVSFPNTLTTIAVSAFNGCSSLLEVTVPASIDSIGEYAFSSCNSLKKIEVLNRAISKGQFRYCTSLEEVIISDNVKTIDCFAFSSSVLPKKLTIPAVDFLDGMAFDESTGVEELIVKVKEIQYGTFNGLPLVSVKMEGVETIGSSAFGGCKNLTMIDFGNSLRTIGPSAFAACSSLSELTIPAYIDSIGIGAFWSCTGLKKVEILNKDIADQQFKGCTSLEDMIISDNVKFIGSDAFANCVMPKKLIIPAVDSLSPYAFTNCTGLEELVIRTKKIDGGTFNRLPLVSVKMEGVEIIQSYAFGQCENLTTLDLGNSVKFISQNAITYCPSLLELTIPASVDSIAKSAFEYCTGLKKVKILNKAIANEQFRNCTSLEDVTISDNVKSIDNFAFLNCKGLKNVTVKWQTPLPMSLPGTKTGVSTASFYSIITSDVQLNVPPGTASDYKNAIIWKDFNIVEGPVPVDVTGVSLDMESLTLEVGSTEHLIATVHPDDANDKSVTWESSDPNIATVSQEGLVTALTLGSVWIKVKTVDGNFLAYCDVTVSAKDIPVTGVSLNKQNLSLKVGESETLIATVEPNDATNKGVKWGSTDPDIATVTQEGVVIALAPGSVWIKVETIDGDFLASCEVTVSAKNVPVTGVSLDKETLILKVDSVAQLTATVSPDNADDKSVTWESSDINIATVSSTGLVTALAPGSASITVKTTDGEYTATCAVVVSANNISVTDISINKHNLEMKVGDSETLIVTIEPENATNKDLIWFNSDESVISLTDGVVTALKAGVCYVMITSVDGNKITSCDIVVTEDTPEPVYNVTSLSLFPNKKATIVAGGVLQVTATVLPENATDKSLVWTSSDETVATVDSLGKISALKAGLATITVTTNDGGKTASIEVSVFGIAVSSVVLDKTADTIPIGSSVQLTATVNPSYATDKTVKWTSSNEAVASVDSTGKVYGIAVGVATIVVEANNGKTDTCVITVYRPVNDVTIELPLVGEESIIIALELPAGGFVTGSFVLTLPEGLLIDLDNTSVSESLSENLQLIVTPLGNNTWLVELAAAIQTYSMRLSSASMFREILNIAYKVDKKMVPGSYEVSVSDVNLMLSDGTKIKKDKLSTNVIISGTTSNEFIGAAKATLINSMLTVDTPDAEIVKVYNVSGSMVYTAVKVEGKYVYSVSNLPNGIYVVTGSKGWQAKVLKK